jgi:hypothetical protein
MTHPATESSPTFPADVTALAAESGVTDYLIPVYEMTRRVFPGASGITAVVDDDPELEDERRIVFNVEIGGLTVEQYVNLDWQWTHELLAVGPVAHVSFFGLHLDLKDA